MWELDDLPVVAVPEPGVAPKPDAGLEPEPEPDADADTDADADAGVGADGAAGADDGVGGFALPLPLEEASRWSSALSASALHHGHDPSTRQLQARTNGEGGEGEEWVIMQDFGARTSDFRHTSVVRLRHVLLPTPWLAGVHNPPIRDPRIEKRVV